MGQVGSQRQVIPNFGTAKQPLCANNSLTPSVASLVHSSGTVYSIMDCYAQGHKNDDSESSPGYLQLCYWECLSAAFMLSY